MLLVVLAVVALAGCGGDDDALVVSAASSLRTAFTELGGARFSFGGSDDLAAQIRQGAPVDVFASADTALPAQLFAEGLVEQPVVFATNRLVLAVPADAARVASLRDLEQPGVTIATGSPDVPVGGYTRAFLAAVGQERSERILANVRSEEPDVGGVIGKLTQGAVDAGFVYITDVEATEGALVAIELPAAVAPDVEYAVAVVSGSERKAAARAFVTGLLEGEGRAALRRVGFGVS
jgi:molybdate transport system substrate-binding protein